jgi:predicted glycoside hydrolase/deacetylase ChbG (UPF0249 family)
LKRLIVNADDFGRTPGINSGIVEAHQFGIVTSATAMVLEPDAADGIGSVRREVPRLSLGLHFVLTGGGCPASSPDRVPSLLIDGRFRRFPSDLPSELPGEEIARELDAQIVLFGRMAGRSPTHLDSHHHSALHPSVQPVFARAALRLGIPARGSTSGARDALRTMGVRTPDHFVDSFHGDGVTAENLRSILDGLEDGTTELMCHPARLDDRLLSDSTYARKRERELAILCDPEVRATVARERIELVPFAEL